MNVTKYKVGDVIVHWTYGIGNIVAIENKEFAGVSLQYYVVDAENMQLWVPVIEKNLSSIRLLADKVHFEELFEILRTPSPQLPDQHHQRRNEIQERLRARSLPDLCHLIRALSDRSHQFSLNQNDAAILSHAEDHLLDEWVRSRDIDRFSAADELKKLLLEGVPEPKVS